MADVESRRQTERGSADVDRTKSDVELPGYVALAAPRPTPGAFFKDISRDCATIRTRAPYAHGFFVPLMRPTIDFA